jgi:glutathione S-transferase
MSLKIYGIAASRAFRTIWMAKELGIPYQHVPVGWVDGGTKTAKFLKINPNGAVPAIEDGSFKLWESMAINLYLAKNKKKGMLYPKSAKDEALTWQWTLWAVAELEKPLASYVQHTITLPAEKRNADVAAESWAKVEKLMKVLSGALSKQPYLTGKSFKVADFNVASVLYTALRLKVDLKAPKVTKWLKACLTRPAALEARKLREG